MGKVYKKTKKDIEELFCTILDKVPNEEMVK